MGVPMSGIESINNDQNTESVNNLPEHYFADNLDRAIAEGWIQPYYMPIVRASNGRVCHEEALARWVDPERGILLPDTFIPSLEATRQVYLLDLHILESVLNKIKKQKKAGLYVVPISINLSRTDFEVCDIVEEVSRRVDAADIKRDRIIIELTENVLGENFEYLKEQIERFQREGFKVWIDDFGSGYSSLNILQEITFDHIKLDMRFMRRFDLNRSKIIITELVRMGMALDTKIVAEGVETAEQVEFLKEIGCNEMQGYYYCTPLSIDDLLKRYESGKQIGFENPEETEYYDAIGTINLYDMSVIIREDNESKSLRRYFDMLPIAVYEVDDLGFTVVRCNQAYLRFEQQFFTAIEPGHKFMYVDFDSAQGSVYARNVRQCIESGNKIFFDEVLDGGYRMHAVVTKIAENHVTGKNACAAVVLDIVEASKDFSLDFGQVARALSADYLYLYYVNMKTEEFTAYTNSVDGLQVTSKSKNFFDEARKDAHNVIYSEDLERFLDSFTREKITDSLETHKTFSVSYRLNRPDGPVYVSMKAVRMGDDSEHVVFGVNSIDAQMRFQKEYEKVKEEGIAYSRMMSLIGGFIALYLVDPDTGRFVEYSSDSEYQKLELSKSGEDFFEESRQNSKKVIYSEDRDLFNAMFTREKVIREVEKNGNFEMIYRLLVNDTPQYVSLKAALLDESDGKKLIVGVRYYT